MQVDFQMDAGKDAAQMAAHLLAAGKLAESKTAIQVAVKPERAKQLKAQFNLAIEQSFPAAVVH